MIRDSFVEAVGWVDEDFHPAYFEDNDLHRRVKLAGGDHAAIATTASVFYHFGSRTQNESGDLPVVPGSMFDNNREYYINKWGGPTGGELWDHPFNNLENDYKYAKRK
jgi:GT2 family glycosyltransferase